MSDKKRLQFDFSEQAYQKLESLQRTTGAATKAEVVRRALSVLELFVTAEQEGETLIVRDKNGHEQRLRLV